MRKFTKKVQGSISLFLSTIILLLVILEGFLIDGSKVLAGKMFMSSAGDMALNAGLTYYEQALQDIYGLFAISKSEKELKDNLEIHFRKTLGDVTGGGDGGYVDDMLSYIETAIQSGWDGGEAVRLLDLKTGGFEVGKVKGSALSEPYVMKSQILEYMKYRGPASLGYGMLEKIHAFKELDKQQKAMEAKLNYEEKMSDVQKACEDAYNNIEPYNKLLEGALKPETVEEVSLNINKNMREAIIAAWCYSAAKRDYGCDRVWERRSSVSGMDVEAAVDACRHLNEMSVSLEGAAAGLAADFSQHPLGTMHAVKATIGYKEDYENFRNLYTTWTHNYYPWYLQGKENLEQQLDDLDDDEDGDDIIEALEELEEEKERYEELYEDAKTTIDQCAKILDGAKMVLEEDINTRMNTAVHELNRIAGEAARLQQLGTYGRQDLDDVIKAMDDLEPLGKAWDSSINDLSSGDIKTSMQLDRENKAEPLDREKIRILQEKLARGVSYAETLQNAARETKAAGFQLFEGQKSTYADWLRIRLEGTPYGSDTLANYISFASFDSSKWADRAKATGAVKDTAYTIYFLSPNRGKTSGGDVQMDLAVYTEQMDQISGKNDEFFKYLERVCPKSEAEKEEKKDAEEAKKELLKKGKSESMEVSGMPKLAKEAGSDSGGESKLFTKTDEGANDKTVSKNAKENSKSSSSFISGVGDLLVSGRDKLYISEYATQMFSYYTVDKMPKASDKETLSGHPLSESNNQMYKAEVEYILWGNEDGNLDVQYTLETIFGIRFLLNSLYAFTGDPEIRQVSLALAVSIAGWTGFGVPLVQSVVILGFALAETARDIQELKEGKSVPIYKSASNWVTKPSGITKQAMIDAVSKAESVAKEYIADKLNELTEDTKEEFRTKLKEYTDDTIDDVVSAASAAVLNPLQERMIGLVHVVSDSQAEVRGKLETCVNGIRTTIASEDGSVMQQAKNEALTYFVTHIQGELTNEIAALQNSDMDSKEITDKITALFKGYEAKMKAALRGVVKPLVDELEGGVEQALDSGNEALQKKTSEALDRMMIRINCGISFADTESVNVDGGKGRTAGSAALTMNYKEYLWLFIAVKSVADEEVILKRIGDLIQTNLACSNAKPAPEFDIDEACTFIEIRADADLSTTFFATPVPLNGGGSVTLGQDKYNIGYTGVLGY